MLLVIQFPLADIRAFIPENTGVLALPSWPLPNDQEFVRYAGPIRRRYSGAAPAIGEGTVCDINNTVKFVHNINLANGERIHRRFSRFYFDGHAVGKFEFGFGISQKQLNKNKPIPIHQVVDAIINTPVKIRLSKEKIKSVMFGDLQRYLATFYSAASTEHAWLKKNTAYNWWVMACQPLVFFESSTQMNYFTSNKWREIKSFCPEGSHLFCSPYTLKNNRLIDIWCMVSETGCDINKRNIRNFRLLLMRLYADSVVLNQVLSVLSSKKLAIKSMSEQSENIQDFVTVVLNRLKNHKDKETIVSRASLSVESFSEGMLEGLMLKLKKQINIRPNVLNRLKTYVEVKHPKEKTHVVNIINPNFNNSNITISDKIDYLANYMAADGKQSEQLQQKLVELKKLDSQIKALTTSDSENKDKLEEGVETLVNGIERESKGQSLVDKNKGWYELTISNMKKAAEAIGDVAKPLLPIIAALKN